MNRKVFSVAQYRYLKKLPDLKKEKNQMFATLIFTVVAITFFAFFAISPTLGTIAQLKTQLADSQKVDTKLKEKIANLNILQQQYILIQPDLSYVFSAIPQTPLVPTLAGEIQTIGNESSIKITRLQTFQVDLSKQEAKDKKPLLDTQNYSSYIYSLTAEGQYSNILQFIDTLTSFQRLLSIDSLGINRSLDNRQIVQLDIRGKAFFKQ